MKLTINSKDLSQALQLCYGAISQNNIIPILGCYLFDCKSNALTIKASDQLNLISTVISIESSDDFKIAIPAKVLKDIISELPDQPLSIEFETGIFIIKSFSGEYKIPFENGEDFPEIAHDSEFSIDFKAEELYDIFNKSTFAVAQSHSILAFNSLLIELIDNKIICVGCDGWVMSIQSLKCENSINSKLLISPKSLSVLTQLPYYENIKISLSKTSAMFMISDDLTFSCLLIDESYPDYKSVIPKENDKFLTTDRGSFTGAIKRLKIFSDERMNDIEINLNSHIILKSKNQKSEIGEEKITGDFKGDEIQIKLKCQLLLDCLTRLKSENITLSFSSPKKAVLIENDDPNSLMMVMPLF